MAQIAFNFGFNADEGEFAADDLDVDEHGQGSPLTRHDLQDPVDARSHTLDSLLSSLPSCLQFSLKALHSSPSGYAINLPQRTFYDMAAQLMAEDDMHENIAHGLSQKDVAPNVYEGGLKTWECAEDLATYIASKPDPLFDSREEATIIELGAGSALPTLSILWQRLMQSHGVDEASCKRMNVILADYNLRVLEVATMPNIFLTWAMFQGFATCNDLEATPSLRDDFLARLDSLRVSVSAMSGGWSSRFQQLLLSKIDFAKTTTILILASETIYSPDNIEPFTRVIMSILQAAKGHGKPARALVAAKRIYFGVGGGIDDFLVTLARLDGYGQLVWQSKDAGVGRAIIEVTMANTKFSRGVHEDNHVTGPPKYG